MTLPKRINFRKSSKGGRGIFFNPKIYLTEFGPFNRAFEHEIDKDNATCFSENEGEGVKSRLEFFRNFISYLFHLSVRDLN